MEITLKMVDEVIERTNVSYKEAIDALRRSDGDLLEAIIELEANASQNTCCSLVNRQEIIDQLKDWVNEGLIRQIVVRKNNRVILDIPVVAGALGAVLFTKSTIVALAAAVATGCDIEVVRRDGKLLTTKDLT